VARLTGLLVSGFAQLSDRRTPKHVWSAFPVQEAQRAFSMTGAGLMPTGMELLAVRYPGREDRILDPLADTMSVKASMYRPLKHTPKEYVMLFNLNRALANGDRYLLLLGADVLLRERAVVSALRTYPGPVIGMSESAATCRMNRFFDHVLTANYYDAEEALAAVEQFERQTGLRPDAVVPIMELTVHVSVAVARHYGLSRLSDECLARARDKHTMKVAFEQANVPCARHRIFSTLSELRAVSAELTYPLVLKPRDLSGNVGTIKVAAPDEIPAAFAYCCQSLLQVASTYHVPDGRFQAEEFFNATHEVSVEVINYAGRRSVLAVTDKSKANAPYFTERGHLVPSMESDNATLRQAAMDACEALLIDRGLAHVEVLINGVELSVVEVGARPGGDGIMDLIDRVYGYNPFDLHIASYRGILGQLPAFPKEPRGMAATTFLKAPVGRIVEVQPPRELTEQETAVYTTARVGDRSGPATSYLTRDGVIECFASGATDRRAFRARVEQLAELRTGQMFTVAAEEHV
jgi:biotin carboxylase